MCTRHESLIQAAVLEAHGIKTDDLTRGSAACGAQRRTSPASPLELAVAEAFGAALEAGRTVDDAAQVQLSIASLTKQIESTLEAIAAAMDAEGANAMTLPKLLSAVAHGRGGSGGSLRPAEAAVLRAFLGSLEWVDDLEGSRDGNVVDAAPTLRPEPHDPYGNRFAA